MTRAAWITAALIAALAGCGLDSIGPGTPDAGTGDGDGGNLPDAMVQPTSGLHFTFLSAPEALPTGPAGNFDLRIERAEFYLIDVRAVGDAAPGDSSTTVGSLMLDFRQPDQTLSLPNAPPGVYSFLIAEVNQYHLRGQVRISGEDYEFEIEDQPGMPLTLNVDLEGRVLESGVAEIGIDAELRTIVDSINWQSFSGQEEDILIGESYNKINDIRKKVRESFKLDG
ncbi:MAG TPA: hypothetical protein VML75_21490 [Kofleriaceae bacterium]|nr:hypothetical protein [Kofleriaceae bacterium]